MERQVDLLIRNVKVFNTYLKKFILANVYTLNGKIFYIDEDLSSEIKAKKIINGSGKYMIPGFIDIHMHIESSMVAPGPFSDHLATCGVTTIVSEPHEIANVMGKVGIKEMIKAGKDSVIDIFYGIPSSVPSTSEDLETTGGKIDYEDMKELMELDRVICVGEVMNYKEVIREDNDLEITKFLNYLNENHPSYVIEGHCPSLVGLDLAKFLYLGIDADHTEHSLEEIEERFKNGMFVEIQHKMLRKPILEYIIKNSLFEHCSFVTDDVMADELYKKGHLDYVVRSAIDLGFPIEEAIYCSTYTPARRMNLRDRGAIAPGKLADFILLDDLKTIGINQVYKNGELIFHKEKSTQLRESNYKFPRSFYESIKLDKVTREDLKVLVDKSLDQVRVRTIKISDGTTQVRPGEAVFKVKDGEVLWQEEGGYQLGLVLERYGKNKNKGFGFFTGDGIKTGAVATTWFHDHHNLFAMGSDIESLLIVINTLIEQGGGFAVAREGKIIENLELPVAGIMSDRPVEYVAEKVENIRRALKNQGYNHYNPIMSVGTLGLPVSPYLKLTDKGLVDVPNSQILDLIIE